MEARILRAASITFPLSQAVFDIFLSRDLQLLTMIDGKIETKMLTQPAQPKKKFLYQDGHNLAIFGYPGFFEGLIEKFS